jgi:hypothetical protein
VLDDRPLVTAHELGHTYGFGEGYVLNPDGTCCLSGGQLTSGFWVQRDQAVINSIDYMGTSAGAINYPNQATQRWSTTDRFADLFRQFRTNATDPEVLLVTGTVNQNSAVRLGPMYRLLNNTASQSAPGDAAVRVLDSIGNIIAEVPFTVDFRVFTDPPTSLDTAPFAFAIPYPAAASEIQIVRGGKCSLVC